MNKLFAQRRSPSLHRFVAVFAFAGLLSAAPLFAQSGGTHGDFALGAGARAMGLGSAYVAMPYDATASFWNPAGLDHIERSNLIFFYAPLLEGTRYNYVGYAYPFVQFGTISAGVFHMSTGDIGERDPNGNYLSTFSYSRTQALVAYGKKLPYSLSLGATLKFDYQSMADGTASGAGLDLGLLYSPDSDFPFLGDFTLGMNLQNALTPQLKLDQIAETMPRTLRIGIAKPIPFSKPGQLLNLLIGFRYSERAESRFNLGGEFGFGGQMMVRAGYDGNSPSFGGGFRYGNYTIDYALNRVSDASDVMGTQHRISVMIDFGKTKTERIELARQLETQRIEEQTAQRVSLRQKLDFEDFMNKGKAYYQQGEFFISMLRFASAREIFPSDPDANAWYDRARQKVEEEQQQEVEREVAQAEEAVKEQFIKEQFDKGMKFLEAGKYSEAIVEWQRGLEQEPDNELLKTWIDKTENEIIGQVSETLEKAKAAEAQNRLTVALDYYDQAIRQGLRDDSERRAIEERIAELRRQLTFNDMFRQGLTDYIEKNYESAMKSFQEALKIVPEDKRVQQYLDDAEARANARIIDFPGENFRRRFLEAVRLIQREDYGAALTILSDLQKQQRYNKRILDAIDLARERQQKK